MKLCTFTNCDRVAVAKHLCTKHYQQMYKLRPKLERNTHTPNDFIIEKDICKIGIYNNKSKLLGYVTINVDDIERCKPHKWCYRGGYIMSSTGLNLHHHILGTKPIRGVCYIDHIDNNTWNNQRDNLRLCNNSENLCNRGVNSNNKSGYKGVYWRKHRQKWEAEINKDGKRYCLGFFDDPIEAAKVYDAKARELHGEFAYQNFPKSKLNRRKLN